MNILYLSANGFPLSDSDPGGTFSLEHARALQAEGARVLAVDLRHGAFAEDELGGLTVLRTPRLRPLLRRLRLAEFLRTIAFHTRIRRRFEYDTIIISFFYLKYLPLLLLLRRRGVTVLAIAHGGEVMPAGLLTRAFKRMLFRLVDVVTPVSEYTETLLSCLIHRRNADNRKIATIPNGIDATKLAAQPERVTALREKLGIGESDFTVLSVCNLIPRKGIDRVVDAVNICLDGGLPVRHVIVGRGPEADALRQRAASAGHGERFHFLPPVETEDLAACFALADIFAMLSITDWDERRTEGFGVTYAEAMALGKPVIGGAGCGASEPVKHGFNGLLIDPYAADAAAQIAAALERLARDRDYYTRLSDNARWHAKERFSWRANARRTLALIGQAQSGASGV